MPDMESLDRAVEEARVRASYWPKLLPLDDEQSERAQRDLLGFEAAVSAKARAEERERADGLFLAAEDGLGALAAMLFVENPPRDHALETMHWLQEVLIPYQADRALRARSSEEAGNG